MLPLINPIIQTLFLFNNVRLIDNPREENPMKFDHVLVPIDASVLSEVAVGLAIDSAGLFATNLRFVYVSDVSKYNEFGSIDPEMNALKMKTEGKLALENAAKRAEKAGIPHETQLIEGIPWQILSEMTKEMDMVIMGVTGKGGIGSGRVGSTAEKVIENSHCPVLTIRSGSRKIEDILLPVDSENMAAIDIAIETCRRVNGKVTVLSVRGKNGEVESLVENVAEKIRSAGLNVETKIMDGRPADVISSLSGMYDLVIMGTHGRQGMKKVLKGSVAEQVMVNSSCPVTIVRDQ